MSKPKVLFVLSSHAQLGNTGKATGWYLPEFAHPYAEIAPHAECVIASPQGGAAPLDPSSVEMFKNDAASQEFLQEKEQLWKTTAKLSDFLGKAQDFAAVFYVGGHGPMFDLAEDKTSQQLIREFVAANKVTAAVCHGPIALANVQLADGAFLVKDEPVTGFTNVEEDQVQLTAAMPFLLETVLKENGARFEQAAEPWGACVAKGRGGRLLTGQNPASAGPLGKALLQAIGA